VHAQATPFASPCKCRPTASSLAGFTKLWRPIAPFGPWQVSHKEPKGMLKNVIKVDRDSRSRANRDAPGAYAL
jgi:hypothetical protein